MPIPSSKFNIVILLCEVDLNCKIIVRISEKLEVAARHLITLSEGIDDGGKAPPIDIVTDCFALLALLQPQRFLDCSISESELARKPIESGCGAIF